MRSQRGDSSQRRRTRTPRAQRHEQLLDLAERILLKEGVGALTMERLADEAGIAKTVPYSHFGNASAVLLAVLQRRWARLDERLRTIAEREELPVMVFLREYSSVYLGEVASERLLLRRLLQAARLDDAARTAIRKRQEDRIRALSHSIERDLGLNPATSRLLATFLLGGLGSLGAREYRDAGERERVVEAFLNAARGAITAFLSPDVRERVEELLPNESSDRGSEPRVSRPQRRARKRAIGRSAGDE